MEFPAGSRYSEVAVASIVEIADDLLAYQRQLSAASRAPSSLPSAATETDELSSLARISHQKNSKGCRFVA